MQLNLFKIYYNLSASYWFIPTVMVICAILTSFFANYIDNSILGTWMSDVGYFYLNQPEGARAVLSTIAGSMITVAGVVFSMTMVAVSFASAQFGPRLIGNFMRDRGNQITLGTFISTYVYCLLILRSIREGTDAENVVMYVPHFSILLALVFAMLSVGVLIFYIHHIPERINISNIISDVSNEALGMLDELFPQKIGGTVKESGKATKYKSTEDLHTLFLDAQGVESKTNGYILAINSKDLIEVAEKHDLIIKLQYRPGDFVFKGETLLLTTKVSEEIEKDLLACFSYGKERTSNQNIMFLMDELVEIMARALSPGINDPFTAIMCMNWQKCILHRVAHLSPPDSYRYDSNNNLRVIVYPVNFELLASNVFDKTRQYVAKDRNTALHAIKIIGDLIVRLPPASDKVHMLMHHATVLNEAAQGNLSLKSDKRVVQSRYDDLQRITNDPTYKSNMRDNQGWLAGAG